MNANAGQFDGGREWSRTFGLALSPLFEPKERPGCHLLLLDGGHGTFAVSSGKVRPSTAEMASWAWSSDIPHHLFVSESDVEVVRWDRGGQAFKIDRRSVDADPHGFYRYLVRDKVKSNQTVVVHLLGLFRRIRTLVSRASLPDEMTTEIFTAALAQQMNLTEVDGIDSGPLNLLDQEKLSSAIGEFRVARNTSASLEFLPRLSVRHASGTIFQEAHFELLRAGDDDLFGVVGAEASSKSRGVAHFTPPAIARAIADQAISALDDLAGRAEIIVCDPACGSGAFLYEVLRGLKRKNYNGRVKVVGRDISEPAISMARFVLSCARADWGRPQAITIDVAAQNSLLPGAIPQADLIVMNPPFLSFGGQTSDQKELMRQIVGEDAGRGDLSMAFISAATASLREGGAIGTLLPNSILSLGASARWRKSLVDNLSLRMIGSIGDFGLFNHALVKVACIVGSKNASNEPVVALVTENSSDATGEGFRSLRRLQSHDDLPIADDGWSLFAVPKEHFSSRGTWRLHDPVEAARLRSVLDLQMSTVGQLFDVKQGVQTGDLASFLLTASDFKSLSSEEQRFFRRATQSDSIQSGKLVSPYYLFFPYDETGKPLFEDESAVRSNLPSYFRKFLQPRKQVLAGRASLKRSGRSDWWGLMHQRDFSVRFAPKVVSKFFGGPGSFILDETGEILPVTGHAWLPKKEVEPDIDGPSDIEILRAYVSLFNSSTFMKVLALFAPRVAGGQFDLSARHVRDVPLPDFWMMADSPDFQYALPTLAGLVTPERFGDDVETLVGKFYGEKND